jgi:hypothetical protein
MVGSHDFLLRLFQVDVVSFSAETHTAEAQYRERIIVSIFPIEHLFFLSIQRIRISVFSIKTGSGLQAKLSVSARICFAGEMMILIPVLPASVPDYRQPLPYQKWGSQNRPGCPVQ